MSGKSSETLIGLFVVGAVALAVAGIAAFGSGMFFTKKMPFIMYFEGAVTGLEVGSPVIFRGVPIGAVKDIRIVADPHGLKFSVPVTAEIIGGKVSLGGRGQGEDQSLVEARKQPPDVLVKALIERGLRAQLTTQSFVTGQLAVSLDMLPHTPVNLRGDGRIIEIPTVPSEFEELTKTLKSLPLTELANRLLSAVTAADKLLNAPATARLPDKLDATLTTGNEFMTDLRTKLDGLSKDLDQAVRSYNTLASNLDQRTDRLSASAKKTLDSLDAVLTDGKNALGKFQKVVNPDSATVVDLNRALAEIAQAAKSIKALTDYLERHPEALIQGKGSPSGSRR